MARRGLAAVREAARSRAADSAERGILLPDGSVQLADPAHAGAGRIRLSLLRSVEDARGDGAAIAHLGNALAARDRELAKVQAERDRAASDLDDHRTASEVVAQRLAGASNLLDIANVLRDRFPEVARILDGATEEIDELRRRPRRDELTASAAENEAARATLDAIASAPSAAALSQALEPFAPAAANLVRRLEAERATALTRPTAADLAAERERARASAERARASAERAQRAEARAQALEACRGPAAALAAAEAAARVGSHTEAAAVLCDVAPSLRSVMLDLAARPESGDSALVTIRELIGSLRAAGQDLQLDEAGHLRGDRLPAVLRDRLAGTEHLAGLILAHEEAMRRPASLDTALEETAAILKALVDQGHDLRLGRNKLLDTAHLPAEVPGILAGREHGAAMLVALNEALARPTIEDLQMASQAAASNARTQAQIDFARPLTDALSNLGIAWNGPPFDAAALHLRREREAANILRVSLEAVTADRDRAKEQWSKWSKAAEDDRARVRAAAQKGGISIEPTWTWDQTLRAVERYLSRPRPAPPPNGGPMVATALDGLAAWSAGSLGPQAADLVAQVVGRLRTAASGSAPDWAGIHVPVTLGSPAPVIVRPLPPPPTESVALNVLEAAARQSASPDHRDTAAMVARPDSPMARAAIAAKQWACANPRDLQLPDSRAEAARRIGAATMPAASRARADRIAATSAEQARRASLSHREAGARRLQRATFSPRAAGTGPTQQRKPPTKTGGPTR
jgi:hypothetical protein